MYIAVDIGGTNTRVAGSDGLKGVNLASEPIRRRNSTDYQDDIRFIVESARQIGGEKIEAMGIGLVGELSEDKATSLHSKNNGHWNGKAFAYDLSRELGCPVFAENDGVAAALGEAYYGSVTSDFAYVIWGTGIGGALVRRDSQQRPDAEILDWHKYFREWEYACGGSEITKTYNKRPEDLTAIEWQTVLDQFKTCANQFIDNIRPEVIVFGGGLSTRHKQNLEDLARLRTLCRVTAFNGDSGLYGGFAVIRHNLEH